MKRVSPYPTLTVRDLDRLLQEGTMRARLAARASGEDASRAEAGYHFWVDAVCEAAEGSRTFPHAAGWVDALCTTPRDTAIALSEKDGAELAGAMGLRPRMHVADLRHLLEEVLAGAEDRTMTEAAASEWRASMLHSAAASAVGRDDGG